MRRIVPYIKRFTLFILLAAALVFVQADATLALPDYMSRIVNVGIQQAGVERALPQAMRQTTYEHVMLFLTPEEQGQVEGAYVLISPRAPEAAAYVDTYPMLQQEPIYVLRDDLAPETYDALERRLARPLLAVAAIEQVQRNPEMAQQMLPNMGLDLSRLPPGMDLWSALARLPWERREAILGSIDARFETIGGLRAIVQAAARATRAEYEALGVDMTRLQRDYILRVGGEMMLVALLAALATVGAGYFAARTAAGLAHDLRQALFTHVMGFSAAELDRFSTASLITRATNDITQIQTALNILVRMIFFAPFMGIGALIRAIAKAPNMWWTIALAVVLVVSVIAVVFVLVIPRFQRIQQLVDKLNLITRENLTGMMVVRAFNREEDEKQRFQAVNQDVTRLTLFVNRVFVIVVPFMMLVMNVAMIAILWVGAHEVARAQIRVGDMIAFMQYAMQVVFAFMMMSMVFVLYPRADVSAHRVADVLETPITIAEPRAPRPLPSPFVPSVEFRHVSFRYPDAEEDMLHDVTFHVAPGQTVGIIGTTGSGKSTLINLIPRFYEVSAGQILVSGVDIRQVSLHDLRARIGYVPQKANLFAGTVESNLRLGAEDADEETLYEALRVAQADFILEHPQGLQAEVAQGGVNFSGGQRQRLTIARALVKRAPIYIFDDCFSALDYKTDARLRRALREYLKGSTIFIVSQRVATIMHADLILVLDEGRLIAQGTHRHLVESCDVYRDIALSQLQEEALV